MWIRVDFIDIGFIDLDFMCLLLFIFFSYVSFCAIEPISICANKELLLLLLLLLLHNNHYNKVKYIYYMRVYGYACVWVCVCVGTRVYIDNIHVTIIIHAINAIN